MAREICQASKPTRWINWSAERDLNPRIMALQATPLGRSGIRASVCTTPYLTLRRLPPPSPWAVRPLPIGKTCGSRGPERPQSGHHRTAPCHPGPMGGTYRAWNDRTYRWPPPDGWYRDDDGIWWAPGTGPHPPGHRPAVTVHSPRTPRQANPSEGVEPTSAAGPKRSAAAPSTGPAPRTARRDRPRRPSRARRVVTRLAVVTSAMTLGLLSVAGVLALLVTTGQVSEIDELQDLRELGIPLDVGPGAASTTTADANDEDDDDDPGAEPSVPTTIIELTDPDATLGPTPGTTSQPPDQPSEARPTTLPTAQQANFGELTRISEPAPGRFRLGLGLG